MLVESSVAVQHNDTGQWVGLNWVCYLGWRSRCTCSSLTVVPSHRKGLRNKHPSDSEPSLGAEIGTCKDWALFLGVYMASKTNHVGNIILTQHGSHQDLWT